eukprot:TRINITY_DN8540_c0_g1_i1.p1 TRINITY_DN8540_c0_g1~~TRINITY_DN8540_c0_g1_i1.p1  ORF type:complete len:517 (-),score=96.82 TRINITY_DN8540_c0_g1_i1:102-1652(-)
MLHPEHHQDEFFTERGHTKFSYEYNAATLHRVVDFFTNRCKIRGSPARPELLELLNRASITPSTFKKSLCVGDIHFSFNGNSPLLAGKRLTELEIEIFIQSISKGVPFDPSNIHNHNTAISSPHIHAIQSPTKTPDTSEKPHENHNKFPTPQPTVSIDLSYNNITDKSLQKIFDEVQKGYIVSLELAGSDIGPSSCERIAEVLKMQSHWLEKGSTFKDEEHDHENQEHPIPPGLKRLNLSNNPLSTGVNVLSQAFEISAHPPPICELDIENVDMNMEALISFMTLLRGNNTLKYLNISNPSLPHSIALSNVHPRHIGLMISSSNTITHLVMRKNQLGDDGFVEFVNAMYSRPVPFTTSLSSTSLNYLDLSSNQLTSTCGETLVKLVLGTDHWSGIKNVNLAFNTISSGVHSLAKAIRSHKMEISLESIDLRGNGIEDKPLADLLDAICHKSEIVFGMPKLVEMRLWGNNFGVLASSKLQELEKIKKVKDDSVAQSFRCDCITYTVDGKIFVAKKEI